MRAPGAALSLAITVLAIGCTSTTTGPSGPPFTQTLAGSVAVGAFTTHAVTSDRLGIATVTLKWTALTVRLDFFVTANTCTTDPFHCSNRAFFQGVPASASKQMVFGVSKGEVVTLWVQDVSGGPQGYTIDVSIQ